MSDWDDIMTERVDILPMDSGQTSSGTSVKTPNPTSIATDVPCSIQFLKPADALGFQADTTRSVAAVLFNQDHQLQQGQRLRDLRDHKILRVVRYKPIPLDMGLYRASCVEV